MCGSLIQSIRVPCPYRNSAGAICLHLQTEPSDSRLPPGAGALLWASHGPQEHLLLFSIIRNPTAGVFCWGLFRMLPKENEEIDLDPCNLLIQQGNQEWNPLQFPTAWLKVILPFLISSGNFHHQSSETKSQFCMQMNCVYQ